MGDNVEDNKIPKAKKESDKTEGLWFNIEYCQIGGENRLIKYEYFLTNLKWPIILLIIIALAIFFLSPSINFSEPLTGWSQVAIAILTALMTFVLVILRENYNSANDKIVYFQGFMMEIKNNMEFLNANHKTACYENKRLFRHEIEDTDDFIIEPIFPIQFEFWELLKTKMNLKDLNMDLKELERFVYDARRYNTVINHRNDLKLFYDKTVFDNRKRYNTSLITLAEYMRDEHLFNAMKKRGILIHFDENKMKHLKKKDACEFIRYLKKCVPKFENIKLTSKNKDDLETSFDRNPDELYIYYFDKHGPVNDGTWLRGLYKQLINK